MAVIRMPAARTTPVTPGVRELLVAFAATEVVPAVPAALVAARSSWNLRVLAASTASAVSAVSDEEDEDKDGVSDPAADSPGSETPGVVLVV
ncbi:MAG: hypothetical protein ACM3VX_01720 [Bacteroidota bacterium]